MADAPATRLARLDDVSLASEELCRAQAVFLPTALVYSNADEYDPAFARRSVGYSHWAREAYADPVLLCTYPSGTLVLADSWFTVFSEDSFVIEQFAPPFRETSAVPLDLLKNGKPVVDVAEPCLLVARYGEGTWGHWLAELLPRAALAERAYPGRFRFAVPAWTTEEGPTRGFAHAVNESLRAYGVAADRIIRLQHDYTYRFDQLFGVTSVWSDHVMHPAVVGTMRTSLQDSRAERQPAGERVALLRKDVTRRNIINLGQVEYVLQDRGYRILALGTMPFLDQVAAFRECSSIFSVLGSELTGLIYASDSVAVASAGPANWADRFFYPLIQLRDGLFADIRGPAEWKGERFYRDAPFRIDPKQVGRAIERLSMPMTGLAPGGFISVSGLTLPRRVGRSEFTADFTAGGNGQSFLRNGWSVQEPKYIWCIGPSSDLVLPAPLIDAEYQLELCVVAAIRPPYIMAQQLNIRINGCQADCFCLDASMDVVCRIPRTALSGHDSLHVELDHPICVSPKALGMSDDSREVSVGLSRIRLRRCL